MINLLLISLKEFWKNLIQNKFVNYTLKQLSEIFEFEIIGDENYSINQVSSIDSASEENLVFISDKKFLRNLEKTKHSDNFNRFQ